MTLVGNPSYGLTSTLAIISRDIMNNHMINGSRVVSETFKNADNVCLMDKHNPRKFQLDIS